MEELRSSWTARAVRGCIEAWRRGGSSRETPPIRIFTHADNLSVFVTHDKDVTVLESPVSKGEAADGSGSSHGSPLGGGPYY
ncbi:UNVERIFIED_CONTAM: hypothetical protein FKN15_038187 [Acipenser sinensis]